MSRHVDDNYSHPPRVLHVPLKPPRKGTPGEGIYLGLYQDWCTRNPNEWRHIFETNGPVRQRAASVAASFIVFMGCNGGAGFTHLAEEFARSPLFLGARERAYRAAWAIDNARQHGMNGGLRTSEYILAREHPYTDGPSRRIDWKRVPDVTQEDNDILESMACWWSGEAARVIRSIAAPMIEAAQVRERAGWSTP